MKCRFCGTDIPDDKCFGFQLPDDTWVCDTIECMQRVIAVVEAAREVVAAFDIFVQSDVGDEIVWDAIGELQEALGE